MMLRLPLPFLSAVKEKREGGGGREIWYHPTTLQVLTEDRKETPLSDIYLICSCYTSLPLLFICDPHAVYY